MTALVAKNAADHAESAELLERVELSLGLLLDQLEANAGWADEIAEIAAAVQRFCPRYAAHDIAAQMQLAALHS